MNGSTLSRPQKPIEPREPIWSRFQNQDWPVLDICPGLPIPIKTHALLLVPTLFSSLPSHSIIFLTYLPSASLLLRYPPVSALYPSISTHRLDDSKVLEKPYSPSLGRYDDEAMTSNLAGIEPPLPTCNRSFPLPPSRTASHDLQQTPRSWPRHAVNPTPNAPASSQDASEPAFKRQKIGDPATHLIGRTTGTLRSVLDISNATSNKCEFLIDGADSSPERESEGKEQQPSLFPGRPSKIPKSGGNQQGRALAIERATARDVVPIKPHVPEPPSSAPRFHKAGNCHLALCEAMYTYSQTLGPADFFPWTGRHAEDVLNELTTKQGFYDKSPISQNESNTARPSVWSSLKHKSGLQILSSLFVSALDQRQTHGTITTNSTFKPPPRVTLTDTKREAWLRDLANPSIPLRRLSRTIPHGIRGKILLDHCLSKDIPTSRAIWLAKCVGANEIRAFKRKGTGGVFTVGGEGKWIKDWTTNVEQFLESILGFCGSTEWRSKINYG